MGLLTRATSAQVCNGSGASAIKTSTIIVRRHLESVFRHCHFIAEQEAQYESDRSPHMAEMVDHPHINTNRSRATMYMFDMYQIVKESDVWSDSGQTQMFHQATVRVRHQRRRLLELNII